MVSVESSMMMAHSTKAVLSTELPIVSKHSTSKMKTHFTEGILSRIKQMGMESYQLLNCFIKATGQMIYPREELEKYTAPYLFTKEISKME